MENREDIDDAVPGFEVRLDAMGQRAAGIGQHRFVFFGRVQPQMATRYHPQDAIFVERDVPLDVPRATFEDVVDIALERRRVDGVEIAVPFCRAVIADGIAHHHHFGDGSVRYLEELGADAVDVLLEPDLHRWRGFRVNLMDEWRP